MRRWRLPSKIAEVDSEMIRCSEMKMAKTCSSTQLSAAYCVQAMTLKLAVVFADLPLPELESTWFMPCFQCSVDLLWQGGVRYPLMVHYSEVLNHRLKRRQEIQSRNYRTLYLIEVPLPASGNISFINVKGEEW